MKFYNLNQDEYKKLSKEFRNTCVGGRISLFYKISFVFLFFSLLLSAMEFVLVDIPNKTVTDMQEIICAIDGIISAILALIFVISYFVYLKFFKNYVDSKSSSNK